MKIGFSVIYDSPQTDRKSFQIDYKDAVTFLKSATTITFLASAIFASAYVAYQNPKKWWISTLSVSIMNLYLLPKILHYGNPSMIKMAIIVNLTALGSLSLGGIGIYVSNVSKNTVTSIKTYQFSTALFCMFFATGFLGYAVPLFRTALQKVYEIVNNGEDWRERFLKLHDQFHHMPEVGLGFLQTNLLKNFLLQISLIKPELILSVSQIFHITPPQYILAMTTAIGGKVTLDQFRDIIRDMEQQANLASFQGTDVPEDMQENFLIRIKIALRSMKKDDLRAGISLLLSNGPKLIPQALSHSRFLNIFEEDVLNATNSSLKEFLALMASWDDLIDRYEILSVKIFQLEDELIIRFTPDPVTQKIQNLTSTEEENFSQRHTEINQEFVELRAEVEKIYLNKRNWQDFAPLWNIQQQLPFEDSDELLTLLHDQSLLQEIEQTYRALIETGKAPNQSLSDRLQFIASKLSTLHEVDQEDELLSVVDFLAINHRFIQKDYEDLQEWLNLDSPHDLDDALKSIGLATEENLYENNILPRQGELSKAEIRANLKHHIEHVPKSDQLAERIQTLEEIDQTKTHYAIIKKVMRAIFHAITSGLLLVPILIHPYAGGSGFVFGMVYFTLKRFEVPGTQKIADFSEELLVSLPFGNFLKNLLNRRVFSLNPQRRDLANQFINANFSGQMRILNYQILLAIFISHFNIKFEKPVVGCFLQGMALADEVVSLI
jgi:hypothetical protein